MCGKGEYCEHAFIDPHLHFEVRYFLGRTPVNWYSRAWSCEGHEGTYHSGDFDGDHCAWTEDRGMPTVIDPEQVLRPAPASWEPRDAGLREPRADCPARGRIECANGDRRVFEIAGGTVSVDSEAPTLNAQLSVAAWRPALYARFTAPPVRFNWQGIRGTRPGVNGYWTSTLCPNQTVESSRGLIDQTIEHFQSSVSDDGSVPTADGEVPREVRHVRLTQGLTCTVIVYTSNAAYPRGEYDATLGVRVIGRTDIALSDPSVTLTWVADLSTGTDTVRDARTMSGDTLHLYTFTARRGNVYKFCTIPGGMSACSPEAAGNVAELLIIGPNGEVKIGITRGSSGLEWEVPDNGPANDDYVLVVRRRVRWEGTGDPHAYTLKYTAPPIGVCDTLRLTLGAFLFVCTPAKPTGLSATTTDDTITASATPTAGALAIEFKRLSEDEVCTADGTTATVAVPSSTAASGATGASSTPVSHPFGGLSAATTYKLCARAVRTIETGFVLRSGWVEKSATTKAQQLAAPGSATAGSATTNSLTLTWTAVSDEDVGQYEVKHNRSTATWKVAKTRTSYKFTGLSAGTAYILSVRALARSGSGRTDSQWEPAASARTKAEPVIPVFTLSASASPTSCVIGTIVSVSWSTRSGSGDVAVTVNGSAVTASPTTVHCQTTAGRQEIIVRARDSAGSTARRTVEVMAREAATLVECLSSPHLNSFVTWLNNGRVCRSAHASTLWDALRAAGIQVGCIRLFVVPSVGWMSYQREGTGWVNFNLPHGYILYLLSVSCADYNDASDASGAGGSACADAVKPAEGAAVFGVGGATCLIVRGGGAVEVSDGTQTLNLTLPGGRDWALFAAADFIGSSAGVFWFLDLTTGSWIALNPADGAELARYAPVDAEGLSALLDAIVASASAPAATE